uniref:ER membrane protein complex subunit 6 n=1 Tax=Romanomermis culicivorax TaxID=13658 RepID=A0A915KB06_ROMCU
MAKKTKNQETGIVYSEMAVRQNFGALEYGRTCQAAASGCAAGILGLTGFYGFAFYFICAFVQSLIWFVKMGGRWDKFFMQKSTIWSHSLFGGLFTYVLLWTFLYGMVHVY